MIVESEEVLYKVDELNEMSSIDKKSKKNKVKLEAVEKQVHKISAYLAYNRIIR
jgi:hypothetical protein